MIGIEVMNGIRSYVFFLGAVGLLMMGLLFVKFILSGVEVLASLSGLGMLLWSSLLAD
jgi:hypothetical protein